jgi:hypothetical protein
MINDLAILSARFEVLPATLGPGWVMRITCTARNIRHIALPFVARVGGQGVEFLIASPRGDQFEGYLRQTPRAGDRLFVGYAKANTATSIVFEPGSTGPAVA